MDPDPRSFDERPLDPELGVRIAFACSSARELDQRRVTQCALSRVCGVCGAGLGRPLAFVGSQRDADRLAFRFPACHLDCADALLASYAGVGEPVLGQDVAPGEWVLVTTASFEFVRPSKDDVDRRPCFQPNGVLATVRSR